MTVRCTYTLRRTGKREVCILLFSLTLGFLLATWLRAPLDSQRKHALVVRRCNATINPRAASQQATLPSSLPKNVIYIGVLTAQKYLGTRAIAVNRTWARTIPGRVEFYSSATSVVDPQLNLPVIRLQGVDDSYPPQKKSFLMIKYMHDNFIDKYEWFMRADDDVYVRGDRLEPFLRSINSSEQLFIGQAGLGKQEELGLLNLDPGDNFCMGGPGMIFSRDTLRKVVPHISYCLKNMWSIHEDVEIGRCVKKFAQIDCTWAYEMQTLFYNNYSKSDTAFTGSLETSDVHKAITLHPIKKTPYMYRLHNYLQSAAIMDLQMKTMQLYRSIFKMRQLLNEEDDHHGHDTDPQLQSLGLQPGLLKYNPDSHEDLIPWNFFGKYWYSTNSNAPLHSMPTFQTQALDHIASQVMGIINSNSMKVGRTINFKEILYGYTRVMPLYGADYVLDLLLMYHKHSKSKRFPVRRHAYLQQSFGKLEIRVDDSNTEPSISTKKVKVDSSVEKLKNGISQTLFGIQRHKDAPSSRHPLQHINKLKETIHFILPLAGRLEILQRFMVNFERICLIPGESVQMIIVLFRLPKNDPSEEIEKLIARYSSKYTQSKLKILHAIGDFSRGLALNLGASQLPPGALMFFVDVDMHISPGFLTRCRLNTLQGRQVYYPVVFGQYSPDVTYGPGTKPESKLAISKDTGFFRHYGYGLVCLYNSDLASVGLVNSSIIGWGMEDVDLYQKFAASNVTIFRSPDSALFHIYHPVVCDPKLESKQYKMCMGSMVNQYGSSLHLAKLLQKDQLHSSEETKDENR